VLRSAALQPGRNLSRNARLFALVAIAMDDALIAVFDAKYHYNFWRPVTAIRNGDLDGLDSTERDATWAPLIETPMHPEYPCAHCILAGTVATVLNAEAQKAPLPVLSTTSATLPGAVRRWNTPDDFAKEVAQARRIIAAFEEAEAAGKGVVQIDGRMVENLHVEQARRTLTLHDAIAELARG